MKIVTPICDYFLDKKQAKKLVEISDVLEIRDRAVPIPEADSYFYHSLANIFEPWNENVTKRLKEVSKYNIEKVSCHMSTHWDNYFYKYDRGFCEIIGRGPPMRADTFMKNINDNVQLLRDTFPESSVALENVQYANKYYYLPTQPAIIQKIILSTHTEFLLDVAHAMVSLYNYDFDVYIASLPLKKCKYIHLSKFGIKNGDALDLHNSFTYNELVSYMNLLADAGLKEPEYVAVEYYKNFDRYLKLVEYVRRYFDENY